MGDEQFVSEAMLEAYYATPDGLDQAAQAACDYLGLASAADFDGMRALAVTLAALRRQVCRERGENADRLRMPSLQGVDA